jgi:indolepyruvate ferredoxin oxidoreductase alpha subunit
MDAHAQALLGDEAVALGALDAGISAAYGYPGTPSTEILEHILEQAARTGRPRAAWCANEKTAYEAALGTSMAGRRALVTMKHVGLNVAADPFVNSGIVRLGGGLVLAVADDPGMHSSQNEQDSRAFADLARVPCLEPADPQQAYSMTRRAFAISERWRIPVMLRLVTRLAHCRGGVVPAPAEPERQAEEDREHGDWILLPAFARRHWHRRQNDHAAIQVESEEDEDNPLELVPDSHELGVITCGLARSYYRENLADLDLRPSHLHIGRYPVPEERIRALAAHTRTLLVLEEGYPWVERLVRGILASPVPVLGKLSGHLPPDGELTPDSVRFALGLPEHEATYASALRVPARPPRLCAGCPHCDAYAALERALDGREHHVVTSDIGCYTLGILPPWNLGESCVCMGASIGMARGVSETGIRPVVAVIGDSTFLHSGIPPLLDAVASNTDMTVLILDNSAVAMTGAQPALLPPSHIEALVLGLGVDPAHCHVVEVHPRRVDELAALLRREIDHRGLSVVVAVRECLESVRKRRGVPATEAVP